MSKGIYGFTLSVYEILKISIVFLITSVLGVLFVNSNVYILGNKTDRKKIVTDFLPCVLIEAYILLLFYFNFEIWYILGNNIFGMFIKFILLFISISYSMLLIVIYAKTEDNIFKTFKNAYIIMVYNLGKSVILGFVVGLIMVIIFNISLLMVLLVLPGLLIMIQKKVVYKEILKYYEVIKEED